MKTLAKILSMMLFFFATISLVGPVVLGMVGRSGPTDCPGDGLQSSQTLVARVLGFDREIECTLSVRRVYQTDDEWSCDPSKVRLTDVQTGKVVEHTGSARFVQVWHEWMILLACLFLSVLSRVGLWLLSKRTSLSFGKGWRGAWLSLSVLSLLAMSLSCVGLLWAGLMMNDQALSALFIIFALLFCVPVLIISVERRG